jgi:hypothetical protein
MLAHERNSALCRLCFNHCVERFLNIGGQIICIDVLPLQFFASHCLAPKVRLPITTEKRRLLSNSSQEAKNILSFEMRCTTLDSTEDATREEG